MLAVAFALALPALQGVGSDLDGRFGGGALPLAPAFGECASPELRARVAAQFPATPTKQLAQPPLIPFFPIGGSIAGDCFLAGYVDMDPAPLAFSDYSCHDFTYDTHRGHDAPLKTFAQKQIGVPVFAARDGVVAFAQDGFADENLFPAPDDGNYVIVDHGDGTTGWYLHLKQFSVVFGVGQPVKAGQQLGLAASSGYSYGPHLHFEVQQAGVAYEPFAGQCRPGPSGMAKQDLLALDNYLIDFGVSTIDLWTVPGPPIPWPTDAQIKFSETGQWFWAQGVNLPANSVYRFRFIRPNGTLEWETPQWPMSNPAWRTFGVWFPFSIAGMQTFAGTWHVQLEFNGKPMIDAPVEVVAVEPPGFNRAPEPITVVFDPASPSPGEVVFCRVTSSLLLDDLDWDIVRYRYQWKVNGQVIRDNVFGGRGDALPRDAFQVGDQVSCTVTPNDGKINGPSASVSVTAQKEAFTNVGYGKVASWDVPFLEGTGTLAPGSPGALALSQAKPNSTALLFMGLNAAYAPALGGTVVPLPIALTLALPTGATGAVSLPFVWPAGLPSGFTFAAQCWIADPAATFGASASNGILGTTP